MKRYKIALAFIALLVPIPAALGAADIQPAHLRCEYLENPLGIDVQQPRLSWIVTATDPDKRGLRQAAFQILVSSSLEKLAADKGDLWDSGRVESDETIHIEYAGKPLNSRMQCHWKVRVWDSDSHPSPWSEPAVWSMGLLKASDWGANWISYSNASPKAPHNGYHSTLAKSADSVKWVAIDLGMNKQIDAVRLYPTRPYDFSPDTPGLLFPVRFKIETAEKADFTDAKTVVNCTKADIPNPGLKAPIYRFAPTNARYVRLTVTRLATHPGNAAQFGFALAEMQVLSGKQNVAGNASVTSLDSLDTGGWTKGNLVDNRLLPDRGRSAGGNGMQSPATMVRKEFDTRGPIRRATVSVTGLGLYELRINGQRVGDHLLAPEWTRYSKRIQYQTYDVTNLLCKGRNAVGAQMCGGWWTGPLWVGSSLGNAHFCLLMRLDIELADGSTQTIVTDSSWKSSNDGPIRRAGIYFGEVYDARKEMPGWDQPGFAAAGWTPARVLPYPDGTEHAVMVAQPNEPIRAVKELKPVEMTEPKPGMYVFDMGQNMVGWCRLKAGAPAGTTIRVRHAEMLNKDGTIYTANLRGAPQVNEYIWNGGEAVVKPHFTYHGFRYVEVTGIPARPTKDTLVGMVFRSSSPEVGKFSCSNNLVNKIMHCVKWVQRGNLMSVPTDCPQRDEREGWMGDIQSFSQTAIFNMDMAGFFTKWVRDIRDSQADNGQYPDVAPHPRDPNVIMYGAPAWADAGTIVPWRVYQNYADTRMLKQHYESAKRWVDFVHNSNPGLLWLQNRGDGDHGDWLNGDSFGLKDYPKGISAVPKDVFGTAFFAYSTEIVAKMAKVLGRKEDAEKYDKLHEGIKASFNKAYVDADGRIRGNTQAGYALALRFNLLDEPMRAKAMEHLVEAIKNYKGHPSTGIQTTHRMMLELSRNGRHDEAWRMINLRTVPSWGYMVDQGATTIWERWDGYVEGVGPWGGFQHPDMNSFNHWALGSVGEWIWRNLAGINPDENSPGYKHFFIRPRPSAGLSWVRASYDSIHGPIVSEWEQADGQFRLHVEIPANTTATVYVPAKNVESVSEGGGAAAKAEGIKFLRMEDDFAVYGVTSGHYDFKAKL